MSKHFGDSFEMIEEPYVEKSEIYPNFVANLYVEKHYKFEVFRRPCFRVDHSSYMSIVHHTIRVVANKASQQCQQKQKTFITSAIIHPVCAFYK